MLRVEALHQMSAAPGAPAFENLRTSVEMGRKRKRIASFDEPCCWDRPRRWAVSENMANSSIKKCKEHDPIEAVGYRTSKLNYFDTAPICNGSHCVASHFLGRGLKRKLGCIDPATQMGRKKKIEDDYVLGPQIGEGKFGLVRLCRSKARGEKFACKTLMKHGEESVHREVEIMQHLSGHPGLVTLKAVYEDACSFHLVMELCPGGCLLNWMTKQARFSERQSAFLLKELILIIKHCHEMGVVHRDIKPENILLTSSGKMKLADFGLAVRSANGRRLSGIAGSPGYIAPDVLLGDYSEKVDIWSAGVLLHGLLVGFLPFKGNSLEDIFEVIKTTNLDFQHGAWLSISAAGRDLLGRMLTRDANARITADEILRHPWILFYTDTILKPVSFKPKSKHQDLASPRPEPVDEIDAKLSCAICCSSTKTMNVMNQVCVFKPCEPKLEDEGGDLGLVDALTAAISRVRISEAKRIRLCGPTFPIQDECLSNTNTNLCTAF